MQVKKSELICYYLFTFSARQALHLSMDEGCPHVGVTTVRVRLSNCYVLYSIPLTRI